MKICNLASGSEGNVTYVETERHKILLDLGMTVKYIKERLSELSVCIEDIDYVFNQIIDLINPQGSIALMGVSENNVPINTRMVLEKGLTLLGNSRSSYEDFDASIRFIEDNEDVAEYLNNIISDEIDVSSIKDIHTAFEKDLCNEFKTIMKWNL